MGSSMESQIPVAHLQNRFSASVAGTTGLYQYRRGLSGINIETGIKGFIPVQMPL
jgi:hypothetical protein